MVRGIFCIECEGLSNEIKEDRRGRQQISNKGGIRVFKGSAKTGGSVNKVISRNGG